MGVELKSEHELKEEFLKKYGDLLGKNDFKYKDWGYTEAGNDIFITFLKKINDKKYMDLSFYISQEGKEEILASIIIINNLGDVIAVYKGIPLATIIEMLKNGKIELAKLKKYGGFRGLPGLSIDDYKVDREW